MPRLTLARYGPASFLSPSPRPEARHGEPDPHLRRLHRVSLGDGLPASHDRGQRHREELASPEARGAYDNWLGAAPDTRADETAREKTRAARQRAEEYPREWEAFDDWLERTAKAVADDWKASQLKASPEPSHYGLLFPDPGESCSGMLAVGAGGALGLGVGISVVGAIGGYAMPLIVVPVWLGAWAGIILHSIVRTLLSDFDGAGRTPEARQERADPASLREDRLTTTDPEEGADPSPASDSKKAVASQEHAAITVLKAVGRAIEAAIVGNFSIAEAAVEKLEGKPNPHSGCIPVFFMICFPLLPLRFAYTLVTGLVEAFGGSGPSPEVTEPPTDAGDAREDPHK